MDRKKRAGHSGCLVHVFRNVVKTHVVGALQHVCFTADFACAVWFGLFVGFRVDFDRDKVLELHLRGKSLRAIAKPIIEFRGDSPCDCRLVWLIQR